MENSTFLEIPSGWLDFYRYEQKEKAQTQSITIYKHEKHDVADWEVLYVDKEIS